MSVVVDPGESGPVLRQRIYEGDVVFLTTLPSVRALVEHTRQQLEDLFRPFAPERAHEHIGVADMAELLGSWKPRFIHDQRSRELVCNIVREAGFCTDTTYFDVPKPRTSFPVGHLTTGIAYAFPWHRDVWYSAPAQQINWWLPVLNVCRDNSMRFDLASFDVPVLNTSDGFDYYEINAARLTTASQIGVEKQSRPSAPGHEPVRDFVIAPEPGAIVLFSGAQLHASIPNTTAGGRFSVDFRTVDASELRQGRGAPLVDAACTGTSIRDFHRVADDAPFDERFVREMFGIPPAGSTLVFAPSEQEPSATTNTVVGTAS